MGAEKHKVLQDGPSTQVVICGGDKIPSFLPNGVMAECSVEKNIRAQVVICGGDKIPSFLPNGVMAECSVEKNIRVAEATISRKAECIVITWCLAVTLDSYKHQMNDCQMRLCVYRGGMNVVNCNIPLPEKPQHNWGNGEVLQMIYCVTLRRKQCVVEAVQPGDKLCVVIAHYGSHEITICTLEANVCVVYDGGGHLLLEVNSELLSKDASRELEEQFGELVLKTIFRRT